MKWMIIGFILILVACAAESDPVGRPVEINVRLDTDGHTVHILAPCATLTPFADYRDFMDHGVTQSSADGILLGHGATYVDPDAVLPPAEATLVFDNSEGCE